MLETAATAFYHPNGQQTKGILSNIAIPSSLPVQLSAMLPFSSLFGQKMNRKLVDQAITLSAIAVEEDQQGNHPCALDLYLTALESLLYAMPIHSDANRKEAIKQKLRDFIDNVGLSDEFLAPPTQSTTPSLARSLYSSNSPTDSIFSPTSPTTPCHEKPNQSGPSISEYIISGAINSAVALKQSPIPDAISATINYTMKKFKQVDETYGLQDKAWEISRTGMTLALEIDEQYNVHEKVANAMFTGLAAVMRAGIAYKEATSYQELKKRNREFDFRSNLILPSQTP
ncbi:430_t:CDS:2 [Ambispora leptoticha]|uniref:430_t:CDS:1 n=1 Tax=Ambispora leptoticha TaxID=144679 RepID=A0A9N8VUT3_9GLOM|nr:430_t:CDS:2 [Ambispora leptoticha]